MEHTPRSTARWMRNAGFKLAPVDHQPVSRRLEQPQPEMLLPGGAGRDGRHRKICPEATNPLLVPDNDIHSSFTSATGPPGLHLQPGGPECAPGLAELTKSRPPVALSLPDGESITLEPLIRSQYRLGPEGLRPLHHLLNSGTAAGVPAFWKSCTKQCLLPRCASWRTSAKSNHAKAYEEIAKRFAKMLGMDPLAHQPAHAICNGWGPDGGGLDELKTRPMRC